MRIVSRLSEVPPSEAEAIPPFNPFKLYATEADASDSEGTSRESQSDVSIRVVELLGGILPSEDGQELDESEVAELVARAKEEAQSLAMRPSLQPDNTDRQADVDAEAETDADDSAPAPNTTVLLKSVADADEADDDLEQSEVRVVRVARGDSLARILQRL